MPELLFRDARIRQVDVRRNDDGVFIRIHMSADWSESIRSYFGWLPDIDETIIQCKLTGEVEAGNMVLMPIEPVLDYLAINMSHDQVAGFQLARVTGESSRALDPHELRFHVISRHIGAESLAGQWMRAMGSEPGNLRIIYGVQAELELEQPPLTADDSEAGNDSQLPWPETLMPGTTDALKQQRRNRARPLGDGLEPYADVRLPEWRTADEIAAGVPLHKGEVH